MAGYLRQIQKAGERVLKRAHRIAGVKFRYFLVTDRTTDPLTVVNAGAGVDIFMQPTPLVRIREAGPANSRFQEVLSAAGNLSAEALPVFILSRRDLFIGGVQFEPTTDDQFQELTLAGALTGSLFDVVQITSIGSKAMGFFITAVTQFHEASKG